MNPRLNGFKLIEEDNEDYKDPDQEEFDWSKINETDEEEDESN